MRLKFTVAMCALLAGSCVCFAQGQRLWQPPQSPASAATAQQAPLTEQILLKDGTRLTGKLIGVDTDTFHIQTSFSKIDVPRSQIVSIVFAPDASAQSAPAGAPRNEVSQSISGSTYTNGTGHFTLSVPAGWKTDDELARRTSMAIGSLAAPDPHERILIQSTPPGAPAKETAQVVEGSFKATFQGYQETAEAPMRIDNRDAYILTFSAIIPVGNVRTQAGTNEPADTTVKVVAKYLLVFVPLEDRTVVIMCVAPDTVYDQAEPTFRQIVNSFHAQPAQVQASGSKR
ncbi:MAG TPA: hypothetical protein VKB26_12550 [Candidatus Acidoferrales bacterium]|nr:hypothetical protein [Candidatus Acidoferrales bacterium]